MDFFSVEVFVPTLHVESHKSHKLPVSSTALAQTACNIACQWVRPYLGPWFSKAEQCPTSKTRRATALPWNSTASGFWVVLAGTVALSSRWQYSLQVRNQASSSCSTSDTGYYVHRSSEAEQLPPRHHAPHDTHYSCRHTQASEGFPWAPGQARWPGWITGMQP